MEYRNTGIRIFLTWDYFDEICEDMGRRIAHVCARCLCPRASPFFLRFCSNPEKLFPERADARNFILSWNSGETCELKIQNDPNRIQTSELETYTDLELSMVWPVCPYQKQVKIKRIRYIRMEWMYYVVAQNICMTHDWKYMHSDCKTSSWRMAQPRFRKRQFLADGFWSFVSQTSLEDLPYLVMTCPFQISLQLTFAYTA